MKTVWRSLKKLKIKKIPKELKINLSFKPHIPFSVICPKDSAPYSTDTCLAVLITTLFTITTKWKQPNWPLHDEWIRKMWYTYTIGFYSTVKKK